MKWAPPDKAELERPSEASIRLGIEGGRPRSISLAPGRSAAVFVLPPAEARSNVSENGVHDVDVISHAQLIWDRQQDRVRFRDGFILPELFDEDVRFRRVAPPEDRPRGGVEKTNLVLLLLVASEI